MPGMADRKLHSRIVWALIFMALLELLIFPRLRAKPSQEELSYSTFLQRAQTGQIASVRIGSDVVVGSLKGGKSFRVYVPQEDASYLEVLRTRGAEISVEPPARPGLLGNLLEALLPVLLLAGFWIVMMRRAQGQVTQALSFGKSPARLHGDTRPQVSFADVAGADEAKEELREIIEFLASPKKFQDLGARIPRGVLLIGPPGSGKTLLAKAVAGEARVPFFSISASEFAEMFVGVGASRVRDLFAQAKANAPCLIFIDEIDAVGRRRGAGLGGGHDEREQTLNQLLVEMDGFDPNTGVIVLAATNRPDVLDLALLRPGRFDRRIVVDNPDVTGRRAILGVHVRGKPLAGDVNLDVLARRTPGFSGADLANVVNEGALLAARRGKRLITMGEMDEAVERVIAGPQRKSRVLSPEAREIAAYHEAGHAVLGHVLPAADRPVKVTILPRGRALGYVLAAPGEDRYTHTRAEILDRITVALGGRVAEEIVFGEVTTGAQNDFEQVTDLARKMVTEYGMSERLGPLALGARHGPVFLGRDLVESRTYSEEIAYEIDKEIRRIIDECYAKARAAIADHRDKIERIARALLEQESLDGADLDRLLRGTPAEQDPGARDAAPAGTQVHLPLPRATGGSPAPATGAPLLRPLPGAASMVAIATRRQTATRRV